MNTTILDYSRLLRQYGQVLRARWRWIMWGVLLALVATTVVLIVWPPLYRSEATVFVRTPGDVSRVRDGGDSYAQARAGTYAVLAGSKSLSERILADLGSDMKPETLAERIKAQNRSGTALIDVAVSAPSAREAQNTATVMLSEYAATVRSLESVPGSLVPRAELVVVDPPGPAVRVAAWGVPIPSVLLGAALLGMFLGSVGAVIRSVFDHPSTDSDPDRWGNQSSVTSSAEQIGRLQNQEKLRAMDAPRTGTVLTSKDDSGVGSGRHSAPQILESES